MGKYSKYIKTKKSNSYKSKNADMMKVLGKRFGKKKKAGALSRFFALPNAVASIPDVIYKSGYENKNIGKEYAKNIGSGLKTTFLGKKRTKSVGGKDVMNPLKGTSDIMKREGLFAGKSFKDKLARNALGLGVDIAVDPMTYLTFGASGLGKAGAKTATSSLSKGAMKGAFGKQLTKSLTDDGVKAGVKMLRKRGLTDDAYKLAAQGSKLKTVKKAGFKVPFAKKNFFETKNKYAAEGLNALANPFSGVFRGGKGVLGKVNPGALEGATKQWNRTFNTRKLAEMTGKEPVHDFGSKYGYKHEGAPEVAKRKTGQFKEGVDEATKNVDRKSQRQVAIATDDLESGRVEGAWEKQKGVRSFTQETADEARVRKILGGETKKALQGREKALREEALKLQESIAETKKISTKQKIKQELFIEPKNRVIGRQSVNSTGIPKPGQAINNQQEEYVDNILSTLKDEMGKGSEDYGKTYKGIVKSSKEASDPEKWSNLGDKYSLLPAKKELRTNSVIKSFIKNVENGTVPKGKNVRELYDYFAKDLGGKAGDVGADRNGINEFLQQISGGNGLQQTKQSILDLRPGKTKLRAKNLKKELDLEQVFENLDDVQSEIDGRKLGYVPREAVGLEPKFIRSNPKFKGLAEEIINHPKVDKELKKSMKHGGEKQFKEGFVTNKTLREVLSEKQLSGQFGSLLKDPKKEFGDSLLERGFDTAEDGVLNGVVYNNNTVHEKIVDGATKAERAFIRDDIEKALPLVKNGYGEEAFRAAASGEKPGIGEGLMKIGGKDYIADKDTINIVKSTMPFFGDEGMNKFLRAFDTAQGSMKAFMTAYSPNAIGYNMRNMIGDTFNMLMDGHRPWKLGSNLAEGIKMYKYGKLAEKKGIKAATDEYGADIAKKFNATLDNGVTTKMTQSASQAGNIYGKGKAEGVMGKTWEGYKTATTLGGVTGAREDIQRYAHFVEMLDQTKSVDEAANAVKRSMFQYQELTEIERNVFKRVVPFYSFMRKNLEFQLENYAKNPGRYATVNKILKNFQNMGPGEMSDEDWEAMPNWMKTGLSTSLRRDGDTTRVLTGFGLPTEAVGELFGGEDSSLKGMATNVLGSSSPFIKTPLELTTGKSFFTGRDIAEDTSGTRYKSLPSPLKKLIGYKEQDKVTKDGKKYKKSTVDPMMAYMLGLPFIGGVTTQYKRMAEIPDSNWNFINLLSGGRVYTKNIESEKERRKQEEMKRLQNELVRRGMGDVYSNFYIPKAQKEKLLKGK